MIVEDNFDLTNSNSYQIKASCRRAYFPCCENDFITIYDKEQSARIITLGGGNNIILSKDYYDDVFVIVGNNYSKVELNNTLEIASEAGAELKYLSEFALQNGLSGLEIYYDIPSSLGGAVVMNAGASGEEIKDILIKVRYLDLNDMRIKELLKSEMKFEYRNSYFQKNTNKIVLKAWLSLLKDDKEVISSKMEKIKEQRWAKQPKEQPNAGSVFKRPKGYFVGAMIDELNLKGLTIGGAKISEKHGGFIVNCNNATGDNILELIDIVKSKVYQKYGVELEIEQRIV